VWIKYAPIRCELLLIEVLISLVAFLWTVAFRTYICNVFEKNARLIVDKVPRYVWGS
jgi:hypothetical protein